jgi:hypothetical protein
MVPIFEQGRGKGIGHSVDSFSQWFSQLCEQHLHGGRARAFAFIFYDFSDSDFRQVLKDQGVFAKLDRLAGDRLSVFYLHSGTRHTVQRFNTEFLSRLGLQEQVTLPCVVFFKVSNGQIADVAAVHSESADLIHGFEELQAVISSYISESVVAHPAESKYWRWVRSGTKFIGVEAFRVWLKAALEHII